MNEARDYKPRREDFEDRVIMVTGATRGIGKAVAADLIRSGARVILHGRKARPLEALYQELKSLGHEPTVAELDFERAQGEAYQQLTDAIEERYGRLDGLLHNAGMLGDLSPIEDYDIGLWQRVMHVNLTAPFILTRCLFPLLRQSDDASLVFTTSGVGNRARAFWGAYSVSKFATEGLAGILAEENDSGTVRCNLINPGGTRTDMRKKAFPAEDAQSLPAPEDITGPYLYLLGRASRGTNGARIEVRS